MYLEHDIEFGLLEWPEQSPDLNPTEHVWDEMERTVHNRNVPPSNLQQLHDAIVSAWTNTPVER
jgi:transposase